VTDEEQDRFEVRRVDFGTESEGPDYFTRGEFQVIDRTTGDIVAAFPWSLDEPYLTNSHYSGPDSVTISEDGTEAIASGGPGGETRVVLPTGGPFAVQFDGVALTTDTDYGALVERIARDGGPADEKGAHEPAGQWLWKLYERLGKTPAASAVEHRITAFLDDPDPRRRACALMFYYFVPEGPGAARLWELAETRRDLFSSSWPGHYKDKTLDDDLIKALSMGFRKAPRDDRRIRVARAEAFTPGNRESLAIALLDGDREWTLEHLFDIAGAQPERWTDVLYAVVVMGPGDRLGEIAATLVSRGIASRGDVVAFADRRTSSQSVRNTIVHALRSG
jgi:hypothetical protein